MSRYINYGIDLGTTNSAIARWDGSGAQIFQNNDQMNVTPSAVRVLKSDRILVGRRAYNAAVEDPDNVALEFKRWIGQRNVKVFPASGRSMSAEELSAEVLKSLLEDVRRQVGEEVRSAVVTTPADFSALQCEATGRAAALAGLGAAPLLQEPIAAAIAYGAAPGSRDQRWMVFDLGGGTLDIAVVSTRDGRLNVVEHRGNKRLGGKDIDRIMVRSFFVPALADSFALPDPDEDAPSYARLERILCLKAAEAKIDLSSADNVLVTLVDIGTDMAGEPMEVEFPLTRVELERAIEPLIDKCMQLAQEALEGARVGGPDLDRILLVGGPSQMPVVRKALAAILAAKVDHSLDPMTVVARGAALYASSVEIESAPSARPAAPDVVRLQLAYDPVSASLQPLVAGKVECGSEVSGLELKVDAEGGYWTSGWLPLANDLFDIQVVLQEARTTRFWVYARDATGKLLTVDPAEFEVRHGLEVSSPPLPHTLSVEVVRPDGDTELTPVFTKGTPLPAENTYRFRAAHSVRPSDPESYLAVKLWEGEELGDAESNEFVGRMLISPDAIRRPIPEGSEVELSVRIDASRRIAVEAFVPHLNEHFSDSVYLPEREQQDYTEHVRALPDQIALHLERIEGLREHARESGDEVRLGEVDRLGVAVEDLDLEASSTSATGASADPDAQARLVDSSREIRSRLAKLERQAGIATQSAVGADDVQWISQAAEEVVSNCGSEAEKKEMLLLRRELDRATDRGDRRAMRKALDDLNGLRWRVLFKQDWFWAESLKSMQQPGRRFANEAEARRWLQHGADALRRGDADELRKAVFRLWDLQPKSEVEQDRESVMRAGLRKY
jgi:molecular chaperone DnaK